MLRGEEATWRLVLVGDGAFEMVGAIVVAVAGGGAKACTSGGVVDLAAIRAMEKIVATMCPHGSEVDIADTSRFAVNARGARWAVGVAVALTAIGWVEVAEAELVICAEDGLTSIG